MVYTHSLGNKGAFWHALLFTIFVFASGLFIGFLVENSRISTVESALYNSEIGLLDQQIRDDVIGNFNVSCDVARQELFRFADSIYEEASRLEEYDSASKFSETLPILHKRYDLLRMMLWTESRQLDARCPGSFHRIVYFYNYGAEEPAQRGLQAFYSRLLSDLKERNGDSVLLIPLAANLEVSSLDVVLASYNITEFPSIFINEEHFISEPPTIEQVEEYIQSR